MSIDPIQQVVRVAARLLLLCIILVVCGCNESIVVYDASQHRSAQIVSVLHENGIASRMTKESGSGSRFRVEVAGEHYSQAVSILNARGLLEDAPPSFTDLTASQGFLPPSRDIEALRMDHAVAGEVATLLEHHPAVLSARVLVRQRAVREPTLPSASVMVETRAGQILSVDHVLELVKQALPGVPAERIQVSLTQQEVSTRSTQVVGAERFDGEVRYLPLVPFLFGWRVPDSDYNGLAALLVVFFLVTAVVGVATGVALGQLRRGGGRGRFESESSQPRLARPDKNKKDLLEP